MVLANRVADLMQEILSDVSNVKVRLTPYIPDIKDVVYGSILVTPLYQENVNIISEMRNTQHKHFVNLPVSNFNIYFHAKRICKY